MTYNYNSFIYVFMPVIYNYTRTHQTGCAFPSLLHLLLHLSLSLSLKPCRLHPFFIPTTLNRTPQALSSILTNQPFPSRRGVIGLPKAHSGKRTGKKKTCELDQMRELSGRCLLVFLVIISWFMGVCQRFPNKVHWHSVHLRSFIPRPLLSLSLYVYVYISLSMRCDRRWAHCQGSFVRFSL